MLKAAPAPCRSRIEQQVLGKVEQFFDFDFFLLRLIHLHFKREDFLFQRLCSFSIENQHGAFMTSRLLVLCTLLPLFNAFAQQPSVAQGGCIPTTKRIADRQQRLPPPLRPLVPKEAFVTLVAPLSSTDTLVLFEMGNRKRHWEKFRANQDAGELTDPDTHIVIFRNDKRFFDARLKDFRVKGMDEDWGVGAEIMNVAHLCSENVDLTYMVLQEGNQGGFFIALNQTASGYKIVPISPAAQGRLILSRAQPKQAEVWSAADTGVCTACAKPFEVQTFFFDGERFRLSSKRTTKKEFGGFQDDPLVVRP